MKKQKSFFFIYMLAIKNCQNLTNFLNSFCYIIVLQHGFRSGTCELTSVLTRRVVRTREILLIIMICVEALSTGNSHFIRAFSQWKVGLFHEAWNFSLRFIAVLDLCSLSISFHKRATHRLLSQSQIPFSNHCEIST